MSTPLTASGKTVLRYDEVLAAESPEFDWPEIDEKSAAAMCYTSGTTGNPKGVVYSHRSSYLHAMMTNTHQCGWGWAAPTRCFPSCRCSTPTRGGCRTAR